MSIIAAISGTDQQQQQHQQKPQQGEHIELLAASLGPNHREEEEEEQDNTDSGDAGPSTIQIITAAPAAVGASSPPESSCKPKAGSLKKYTQIAVAIILVFLLLRAFYQSFVLGDKESADRFIEHTKQLLGLVRDGSSFFVPSSSANQAFGSAPHDQQSSGGGSGTNKTAFIDRGVKWW